jgi:protein TonB
MTDRGWNVVAYVVATSLHVTVALLVPRAPLAHERAAAEPATQIVDVELPKPVPSAPAIHESAPGPPSTSPHRAQGATTHAQAAPVLTRAADVEDGPADMTDTIVTGTAVAFTGGATTTRGDIAATKAAKTTPEETRAPRVDRAKPAAMLDGEAWKCPFPPEAETIDSAVVTMRVVVDASGAPKDVAVQVDPGHGFGREARRCASAKRWTPAQDGDGKPTEATVTVRVHFDR